ncbi:Zinc finger protein 76 [Fusarium oxysporum f. sp. albedinis]|nr:Zinc finger protein 76 [Fusarium oxysporum f. sp. albedinis]
MSNDTVRPDECDDETNRTYSTNVHSEKLHLPSEPKDNQPSRLLVGVRDMQRSNLITSQQAVASGVMVRSSTAGSRPSTFAAASFLSQNAKDVVAVAITATTGHTRRPRRNGSSHSYDLLSPAARRASQDAETSRGEGAKDNLRGEGELGLQDIPEEEYLACAAYAHEERCS